MSAADMLAAEKLLGLAGDFIVAYDSRGKELVLPPGVKTIHCDHGAHIFDCAYCKGMDCWIESTELLGVNVNAI